MADLTTYLGGLSSGAARQGDSTPTRQIHTCLDRDLNAVQSRAQDGLHNDNALLSQGSVPENSSAVGRVDRAYIPRQARVEEPRIDGVQLPGTVLRSNPLNNLFHHTPRCGD